VPERLNGRDWKSRDGGNLVRGFESPPLRTHTPRLSGRAVGGHDGVVDPPASTPGALLATDTFQAPLPRGLVAPMLDESLVLVTLRDSHQRRLVLTGAREREWHPAVTALIERVVPRHF
jgi:hypothetical protein